MPRSDAGIRLRKSKPGASCSQNDEVGQKSRELWAVDKKFFNPRLTEERFLGGGAQRGWGQKRAVAPCLPYPLPLDLHLLESFKIEFVLNGNRGITNAPDFFNVRAARESHQHREPHSL